ncbi:ankyrin repeat-containing domain protein [Phyllosticta capitalensis]|uniref:ankyrin repeat-containing domain protein n=1 Tax=Phyllosticta capitalensis TaxID=121624 RepID=UPI00313249E7
MADPLSVAASVAGLVSLADVVFRTVFRYAKSVKNAKDEVTLLAEKIQTLFGVLQSLKILSEELHTEGPQLGFQLQHLKSCEESLKGITAKLEIKKNALDKSGSKALGTRDDKALRAMYEKDLAQGLRFHHLSTYRPSLRKMKADLLGEGPGAAKSIWTMATWPLSSAETKELIGQISEHQKALSAAMVANSFTELLKSLSVQEEIRHGIEGIEKQLAFNSESEKRILLEKRNQSIVKFFRIEAPSLNHDTSLRLRHPGTGQWLIEHEEFKHWLKTPASKLWLSGIPGAGKTVLAAMVIEHCLKQRSPAIAVAYVYCDYLKIESQDPVKILGTIATQIANQDESQNCHRKLAEFYAECRQLDPPRSPEAHSLGNLVRKMSGDWFDEVRIIVDAIDECGENQIKVIENLIKLNSSKGSKIKTLFISRPEHELKIRLETSYIHIPIAAQNVDLRAYVKTEVETRMRDHRLRIRSPGLKEEIMERLVNEAKGMFRWVACQIEYLCNCTDDEERRQALHDLPPGLSETYERILERVNKKRNPKLQKMVQNTLRWLLYGPKMKSAALCEALAIKDDSVQLNPEAIPDEEAILIYCSSLVRKSVDGSIELSHFTVKEFLHTTQCLQRHDLASYHLNPTLEMPRLARQCLQYLNLTNFNSGVPQDPEELANRKTSYPFRDVAVEFENFAQGFWNDSSLLELAKKLFDPTRRLNLLSWAQERVIREAIKEDDGALFSDEEELLLMETSKFQEFTSATVSASPLHFAAILGIPQIIDWLLSQNFEPNQTSKLGSPVHCALRGKASFKRRKPSTVVPLADGAEITLDSLSRANVDCSLAIPSSIMGQQASTFALAMSCSYRNAEDADRIIPKLLPWIGKFGGRIDREDLDLLESWIDHSRRGLSSESRPYDHIKTMFQSIREEWVTENARAQFSQMAARTLRPTPYESGMNVVKRNSLDRRISPQEHVVEKLMVELLAEAAVKDEPEVLKKLLLHENVDVDSADDSNTTALHLAASRESLNALKILLNAGASVEKCDAQGQTALHHCVFNLDGQAVALLLSSGADSSAVTNFGLTIWDMAAQKNNVEVLKALLSETNSSSTPHSSNSLLRLTSMCFAAKLDAIDAMLLLMQNNKGWETHLEFAMTLVHLLFSKGKECLGSVAHFLADFSDEILLKSMYGLKFLEHAILQNNLELVQKLLDRGIRPHDPSASKDYEVETPLERVCLQRFGSSMLDLLLQFTSPSDLAQRNAQDGMALIHRACSEGSHSTEFLERLIREGVDINWFDVNGKTALMVAVDAGKPIHAATLLRHGADTEIRDSLNDWNFLHYAADAGSLHDLQMPIPDHVWEAKCSVLLHLHENSINSYFLTEVGSVLIKNCGLLHLSVGRPSSMGFILEKNLIGVNCPGEEDFAPLHHAAFSDNIQAARMLISHGANVNAATKSGVMALHLATHHSRGLLEFLLQSGANPAASDKSGNLPLHVAAFWGKNRSVSALLEFGHLEVLNKAGDTPELCAIKQGQIYTAGLINKASRNQGLYIDAASNSKLKKNVRLSRALFTEIATGKKDTRVVKRLLQSGANIDVAPLHQGVCRCTPLVAAFENQQPELASLLIDRGASLNFLTCGQAEFPNLGPAHLAAYSPVFDQVLKLLLQRLPQGFEIDHDIHPIHIAVVARNRPGLEILLEYYSQQTVNAERPMECPTPNNSSIQASRKSFVGSVINRPSQMDFFHNTSEPVLNIISGYSPLEIAAMKSNLDIVKTLLSYGAAVDGSDDYRSPLLSACQRDSVDISQVLLESGANPHVRHPNLDNPAAWALDNEIRELLEQYGAEVSREDWKDCGIDLLRLPRGQAHYMSKQIMTDLEDFGYFVKVSYYPQGIGSDDAHAPTFYGNTLAMICGRVGPGIRDLFHAWSFDLFLLIGSASTIKKALKYESKAKKKFVPLQTSFEISRLCQVALTRGPDILELLAQHDPDIDAEGCPDGSALMAACAAGRYKSVQLLVRKGAKLAYTYG